MLLPLAVLSEGRMCILPRRTVTAEIKADSCALFCTAGVLMQKEKSPEDASKLWANLAGITGAHIDALAAQAGMHDQLTRWFNFTALTNPPFVQDILNYTQARRRPSPP